MIRRPPISTRTDTLFPYTTLFRSDVILGQTIPAFDAGLCNDMNSVVSAAHHVAGHIIGNDPVAALSGKLGLGMVQDLLGFSRKTDEQARALRIASQTGQYVRIFDQLQRRRRFALFLDFLSVLFGAPVSNGGHHDCRVGGKRGVNGGLHFARCFHVDAVDTGRGGKLDRAGHQRPPPPGFGKSTRNARPSNLSGFSISFKGGGASPFFLIFCPFSSARQSATAATMIAASAGSAA